MDMWKYVSSVCRKALVRLHVLPLSLAEKCRVTFGAAVVLVLVLALLLPYIWMKQLTEKGSLDIGRTKSEMLFTHHFKHTAAAESSLAMLDSNGRVIDANESEILWIRFSREEQKLPDELSQRQKGMIESLISEADSYDDIFWKKKDGVLHSNYVRIFRAGESCISCHNPQGSAGAFRPNELIGAAVIERSAGEIGKTILMNRFWTIVAGLIAGTGAIVAFYMITQRVILWPIRQLRAIANDVAEGNLDSRSAIKTRDEYQKLADAFNHMLDALQGAQEKLRLANKQLDDKIVELSKRNVELFNANKLKGEFLANISHEFRTPLNAILGFAEILREKTDLLKKDKGKRYAENIITSGNRLLNMINDLLDLAKTEAGKMELHIEKTSLSELCNRVVGHFTVLTRKKRIRVKVSIDQDVPPLMTDAGKVEQILYNFLSNAVKFTPKRGGVDISASMTDERHVRIAVSDTGCGIAETDREKIFEKFRQVDGSITRQTTGSGLGLTISKELAAMLAGSIGMESAPDKGSTFWIEIAVTITKERQEDQSGPDDSAPSENSTEHEMRIPAV